MQLEQNGQDMVASSNSNVQLVRQAQLLRSYRQKRREMFDAGLFDEPAWDALLVLYVDENAGTPVRVTRLAELLGSPLAPFLRWLRYLERLGLVSRAPGAFGASSGFVGLTAEGRADLERYLSETLALAAVG